MPNSLSTEKLKRSKSFSILNKRYLTLNILSISDRFKCLNQQSAPPIYYNELSDIDVEITKTKTKTKNV